MLYNLRFERCHILEGVVVVGPIGERIRKLRESKSITQGELGKLIGVSGQQVSEYERGRRKPSRISLERLSKVFGVSVDYLLGRADDPIPRAEQSRPLTPAERLQQLGIMLRSEGATEEDVKVIMDLIESRKKLREAAEDSKDS